MKDNKQADLFERDEWWKDHWKGMPEFVQGSLMPFKTLYVHFENQADVDAFAILVHQRIKSNTKYIWFPEPTIGHYAGKAYVD